MLKLEIILNGLITLIKPLNPIVVTGDYSYPGNSSVRPSHTHLAGESSSLYPRTKRGRFNFTPQSVTHTEVTGY